MSLKPSKCAKLEKKLAIYVAAAAGAVSIAPPVNAGVVYTKANLLLTQGTLPIDLNHDGVDDFFLLNHEYANYYYSGGFLAIVGNPQESPGVLGQNNQHGIKAFAVPLGVPVGPDSPAGFVSASGRFGAQMAFEFLSYNGRGLGGPWVNVGGKYLGFRFTLSDGVHYGWARLSVNAALGPLPAVVAKLSGYAYEAIPNQSIPAGYRGFADHGSLGALSLGAAGLSPGKK
ncbi:MAG TPA: hypothetical protein VFA89_01855 [Terriglobales bacterium]|nr:hypothetical protein [Terriglobales bacterium]